MVPVLTVIVFALLDFESQPLPGVVVGPVNELTGQSTPYFLQQDIDGDGARDLVLPSGVALQRSGRFPDDARFEYPESFRQGVVDAWDGQIYCCKPGSIERVHWKAGKFETNLQQPLQLPDSLFNALFSDRSTMASGEFVKLRRYLHDLAGDASPEIVIPVGSGLSVFTLQDGTYTHALNWDIFPPTAPAPLMPQKLWPAEEREAALPPSTMSALYTLNASRATVLQRHDFPDTGQIAFTLTRSAYPPDRDGGPIEETRTPELPAWVQPCRLNQDDVIDFAGGRLSFSDTTPLPTPLFEVAVSTDGGRTINRFRSQFLRPSTLFTDVNGDGRLDLLLENTGMFLGGTRETMNRTLTSKSIDHSISIHYLHKDGSFSPTSDLSASFTLELSAAPIKSPPLLERYRRGALVNLTGDLNNDGMLDLVIHDRQDRIRFYLNQGQRFRLEPGAQLTVDGPVSFSVFDVNDDRRADILVYGADGSTTAYLSKARP